MKHDTFGAHERAISVVPSHSNDGGVYTNHGKRLFDLVFAILILPFLLPVITILGLLVALDGKSPFFGHKRVGRNGRTFRCWKVRSMVVNADEVLVDYLSQNSEAAAEWRRDFKLTNDPRITRLGRFLRKSSLDELPQIINVLCGNMSFVGPRPVVREELERYGVSKSTYMALNPGITGLWQVSGRNDVSYARRVRLDVHYARNMSFLSDLAIVFMTVKSCLNMTGK